MRAKEMFTLLGICEVSEKLWLFNHKRAEFSLPNFGFERSLLITIMWIFSGILMRIRI